MQPSNYSIQTQGRAGLLYSESEKSLIIDCEMLVNGYGLYDMPTKWGLPFENETLTERDRDRILLRIQRFCKVQMYGDIPLSIVLCNNDQVLKFKEQLSSYPLSFGSDDYLYCGSCRDYMNPIPNKHTHCECANLSCGPNGDLLHRYGPLMVQWFKDVTDQWDLETLD